MLGTRGGTIKRVGTMTDAQMEAYLTIACRTPWKRSEGAGRDYWAWTDGEVLYVKLDPGQEVHPHTDTGTRIHYVLQTNPDVLFMVDGKEVALEEGGIYELDTSKEHACVNGGDTPRIHRIEL